MRRNVALAAILVLGLGCVSDSACIEQTNTAGDEIISTCVRHANVLRIVSYDHRVRLPGQGVANIELTGMAEAASQEATDMWSSLNSTIQMALIGAAIGAATAGPPGAGIGAILGGATDVLSDDEIALSEVERLRAAATEDPDLAAALETLIRERAAQVTE